MANSPGGLGIIRFEADDPQQLVNWLCAQYGLTKVLRIISDYCALKQRATASGKRPYKQRAAQPDGDGIVVRQKTGGKKGRRRRGRPARKTL